MSAVRPPLYLGKSTNKVGDTAEADTANELDISENSRSSLRRSWLQRRPTLTMRESQFLERLIETGNEIEVQVAHENLLNDKLFFETADDFGLDDGEAAFRNSSIGSGRSSTWSKSLSSLDQLIAEDAARFEQEENRRGVGRCASGSTDGLGSELRRELLQQRRLSPVHGKIWQAHESGLAVTSKSSRRSMLARTKSLKQIRLPSHRADDIFRSSRRRSSSRSSSSASRSRRYSTSSLVIPRFKGGNQGQQESTESTDDVTSDNNRTRPVVPVSPSNQKPFRPSLRRLASDVSRKSVTFDVPAVPLPRRISDRAVSDGAACLPGAVVDTLPPRPNPKAFDRETSDMSRRSEHSFASLHMAHPIRSQSMRSEATESTVLEDEIDAFKPLRPNSPPSIHHGRPIRSESMSSRQNSITESILEEIDAFKPLYPNSPPSIHHGRPIRSESMSSRQNSITTFDSSTMDWLERRDPSNVKDEKKDDNEDGIPSKVVIPTTGSSSNLEVTTNSLSDGVVFRRPVLLRHASSGVDEGVGIEVADYDADLVRETRRNKQSSLDAWESSSVFTSNSFDETMSFGRVSGIFRRRPTLERAMSDEDIRGMYLGDTRALFRDSVTSREVPLEDDEPSWHLGEDQMDFYDSWMVIEDEYINGYGGGGTLSFRILGTSALDKSAMPHVLSPPLMESLEAFFPYNKMGESFWLKYSMVRDGAGLHSLLRHARGSQYTIMAMETTDGEVFGAFLGEPWRKNWNYYGSSQSFVWRMRHSRREKTHSIIDQAHMESEIDVFHHTGENRCFQLCTDDHIAVGGGTFDPTKSTQSLSSNPDIPVNDFEWGPSLMINDDLLQGTSYPCLTFGSPSLSKTHADGSLFEIINLEIWTLTPCLTLDEAEKLELGRLFLEKQAKR